MDLTNIPKHAWWIITLTILIPIGFLITALGILLVIYSSMLPHAKGVVIDTPYLKIVSEFASQQIVINNDLQKIIAETSNSINSLTSTPTTQSNPLVKNSSNSQIPYDAKIISKISSQAPLLKEKKQQLEKINNELLQVKEKIQAFQLR